MPLFSNWQPRWFGYYRDGEPPNGLPTLAEITDPAWSPEDKADLVRYLSNAPCAVVASCGHVNCKLCGRFQYNASEHKSDGEWLWPGVLAHEVAEHAVRLPDQFVEHIRSRRYDPTPSVKLTAERVQALPWPKVS